ncbi:hypothetical protein V4C53_23485 [Paraburkholderia azotifigens]|uniref:hypothetical protein n=1 Tax=Paraburkholderia azotifigens TaxID=2057004 RepID=UPI003176ED0C
MKEKTAATEAMALEREVHAASQRLEAHYAQTPDEQPSTLELARFAAAMQELKDAREAFDALLQKRDASPP